MVRWYYRKNRWVNATIDPGPRLLWEPAEDVTTIEENPERPYFTTLWLDGWLARAVYFLSSAVQFVTRTIGVETLSGKVLKISFWPSGLTS